jgi:streptogramin lyase
VIWYSDYSRGFLGRLDPKTGDVKEYASPSGPKSQPYGITALNDIIWYSESAVSPNTLVRFDPKTAQFQTWAIPGRRRRGPQHDADEGRGFGPGGERREPGGLVDIIK